MKIPLNSQIIDLNWSYDTEYFPQISYFDGNEVKSENIHDFFFNLKLSPYRKCVGYYEGGKYFPCINSAQIEEKYERCMFCEGKLGFKSAFLFGATPNENAKRYLSKNHFIYLAYFEPGIIKVGTASESRRLLRPIEQDALLYIYIAQNSGFKIQELEKAISSSLQITETVSSKVKFKYIGVKPDIQKAKDIIFDMIKQIKSDPSIMEKFGSWFLPEKDLKFVDITQDNDFIFPEDLHLITDTNIYGKLLGIRGKFVILDYDNSMIALSRKDLIGRIVEDYLHNYKYEIQKKEQLSLI